MMDGERLRVGYIPLVDAAALSRCRRRGFRAHGLDIELFRMRAHQSAQFLRCTIISQLTVLVRD
jgi:hypothetical protein